jgi:hypothetical protein
MKLLGYHDIRIPNSKMCLSFGGFLEQVGTWVLLLGEFLILSCFDG